MDSEAWICPYPLNSREWWDEYFSDQWDAHGGSAQTAYFMKLMISALPQPEASYLNSSALRILDWGCAFGEGLPALAEAFPNCEIVGQDFSLRAVQEAGRRNPGFSYVHSADGEVTGEFDVIVTSNCLEHLEDPLRVAAGHIGHCRSLYILMVPYDENPLHPVHRVRFTHASFPLRISEFERLCLKILDSDSRYWPGQQALAIYCSPEYFRGREEGRGVVW
jgi:SAM-dependent methyltransferase